MVFNGETNNYIPSEDNEAVETLRSDIGGLQELDNLKKTMIQETRKLADEFIPENKTSAGIADKQRFSHRN